MYQTWKDTPTEVLVPRSLGEVVPMAGLAKLTLALGNEKPRKMALPSRGKRHEVYRAALYIALLSVTFPKDCRDLSNLLGQGKHTLRVR